MRDAGETERAITAFAHSSNGGLIVGAGTVGLGALRDEIIKLAARHRLPTIYSDHAFVTDGGLIAYGPDRVDLVHPRQTFAFLRQPHHTRGSTASACALKSISATYRAAFGSPIR